MISLKYLILLARPEGFEPPTPRFVVWCSIQLSYGRLLLVSMTYTSASDLLGTERAHVCGMLQCVAMCQNPRDPLLRASGRRGQ